jgi:hypothetical protein
VLEGIIASIISVLANVLYIDLKRKGKPGFSRFILFWMGTPLTWLWFFIIKEGSAPAIEEAPDDAAALLAEIRRDRRLRPGEEERDPEDPLAPG